MPPKTTSKSAVTRGIISNSETARPRRVATTSTRAKATTKRDTKADKLAPEDLANELASKLHLDENRGQSENLTPYEQAREHMRVLDSVSHDLSAMTQKRDSSGADNLKTDAHARTALRSLKALRTLNSRDTHTERVAVNIIGKLLVMEKVRTVVERTFDLS
jgi:superfamily II DNA helicase RecQ